MNNAQALQAEDSGGTQRELLKLSSGNVLQIAPANHAVTFGTGTATFAGDIVTQGDMVHLGSTDADFRIVFSSKGGVYGGGSASSNAFHNIRGTGSNIIFNTGGASDTFIYEYNGNGAKQTFNSDGSATFAGDVTAYSDTCLLYTSPSPRDATLSRMPSSA